MAVLIPAEDHLPLQEVTPEDGSHFHLPQLYRLLSCHLIEILPLEQRRIMICDEESKLTGKPRNERATLLAGFAFP